MSAKNWVLSDECRQFVNSFEKKDGSWNNSAISIENEMLDCFGYDYSNESYQELAKLITNNEVLRRFLIFQHDTWHDRWLRTVQELKELGEKGIKMPKRKPKKKKRGY